MRYNFDEIIDRRGTFCEKFDRNKEIFGREDVIPMWIADMEFATPRPVLEAIQRRAEHPVFGYSYRCDSYFNSIINWVERRAGWKVERKWIDFSPGIVSGIVFAIRAFTKEGDKIVIQPPVYHPFARQIKLNNRVVVNNPLALRNDRFEIDFEDLDLKLKGAKMFLMSNPHNPSGRVYTREELMRIGELCVKHDVLIVSDEIHSDLIYKPFKHTHIASISDAFAQRTITYIAPSKTFNIAGFSTSVVITPNDSIRRQLQHEFDKLHADQGNIFGTVALEAAYNHGDEWLDQLNEYIAGNIDYVLGFLRDKMPSVKCIRPEGTYLMWLDFGEWPMSHEEIYEFLIQEAALGLNEGSMFGEQGRGWMRMNVGTQRAIVVQAMKQLYDAYLRKGIKS